MSLTSHRCCVRLKILKQAWIFSASPTITLSGLCIPRKAINKDKHTSSGFFTTTEGRHMRSGAWRVISSPVSACAPVPGRHYQIVTGGNALGFMTYHLVSAWMAVRRRMSPIFSTTDKTDRTELKPLNPLNHLNILNPLNHLNILNPLNLLNILNHLNPILAIGQKHQKPLAVDARCLIRAIDAVPV